MTTFKSSALCLAAILLLTDGAATSAISQTNRDDKLTPQEIMQKSQDTYAALTNYSDEGITVTTMGATTLPTNKFAIKLQRPDLYRIDWDQDNGSFVQKGVVWSVGQGNFLKLGAAKPTPYAKRETALGGATGVSGDASGSIPGTFFNRPWGNQFGGALQGATRKPDQKVGEIDCFVLIHETPGRTRTLWIGKQDSLIHQIEDDTSAETFKAGLEENANRHPEMHLPAAAVGALKSIQTHTNIVINQPMSPARFDYETRD